MNNKSETQRIAITLKIMAAMDEWGLTGNQILSILDMPEGQRTRHLQKFRSDTPFPDVEQVNNRIVRLLGIIDALRTTYPL